MGSLVKIFEGQNKVWMLGKSLTGFISHNQSSAIPKIEKSGEIKRPASAFALFLKEKNPILRQRYPNLKQPQIMKLASSMWKTESEVTKQRHRQEYDRMLTAYKQTVKEVPSRPSPPFVQFFSERNKSLQYQYPNLNERVKRASLLWKNLSIVERQRYTALYKNKMDQYNNNLSEEDLNLIQEKKDAKTLKQQKNDLRRFGKEALKVRPVLPVNSGYKIFLKENASVISDKKNLMKIAGQQWRSLPVEQKSTYQKKVDDSMKVYEQEVADWEKKYDRNVEK